MFNAQKSQGNCKLNNIVTIVHEKITINANFFENSLEIPFYKKREESLEEESPA